LGITVVLSIEARIASTIYDKGLIFMKDRDILQTGDKWTVTVNIALGYASLIQGMRFILAQTLRYIGIHRNPDKDILDIHWDEID
jgi:hypothetical protein